MVRMVVGGGGRMGLVVLGLRDGADREAGGGVGEGGHQ